MNIKNYLKDAVAEYGRLVEMEGRTWRF